MSRMQMLSPETNAGSAAWWLDAAIEVMLASLLVFMPAALGVVAPWSETVVAAGATALALALAARPFVARRRSGTFTWAYLPISLFILAAAFQLLPLSAGVVGKLSPETLATRHKLLGAGSASDVLTLSFYPLSTRQDLRIVLIASVIFATVLEVYRQPEQIKRLLAVIAGVGGAAAVLALLQDITGAEQVYWNIPSPWHRARSGPFISYSNFSQFMNLSIGAAIALLLVRLQEFQENVLAANPGWEPSEALRELVREGYSSVLWLAGAIVLGVVAIFLSSSRGGMVSMLAATTFVTVLLMRRKRMRAQGWIVSMILLTAFVALLYGGFESVCDRLASLYQNPDPTSGRLQTYKDLAMAWKQFPLLGTGLGTHEHVYPMFDRSSDAFLAEYADADWFQLAEEMGTVGLVLVLAFAAFIAFHFTRAIRATRPVVCVAAFGLGYGLLAVMVQSFTDFGQHLPSIAALSAVTCALLVRLSRLARPERTGSRTAEDRRIGRAPSFLMPVRAALPLVLVGLSLWVLLGCDRARRAAAFWDDADETAAQLAANNWDGTDEDYIALLTSAQSAVDTEPQNVEYRYLLNCYRWRSLSRTPDDADGSKVALTDEALGHTQRIVRELLDARNVCPTYGPLYSMAGQLEAFALNQPSGAEHVRLGYQLARTHPLASFAAGQVEAAAGNWTAAEEKFRRCLQLDPAMFSDVANVCIRQVNRPDLAVALCGPHAGRLAYVYSQLEGLPSGPSVDAAHRQIREALEAVKKDYQSDDVEAFELASVSALCYEEEKDLDGATKYLKRAIAKDYGQVTWHLRLAELLAEQDRPGEAADEARTCLHLQPKMERAKQLLGELAVRESALPGN